ncbi:MAG: hypothetical protein Q4F84_00010 [Fibrobacter sp.]|nr:hypothetical protein [Fibrobacter sp.]
MTAHFVLILFTLAVLFILFLVISRTMNNTINLLVKLEYLFQKEHELKQEAFDVKRLMEQQALMDEMEDEDESGDK